MLTKPLGTGVVATAIKAGACPARLMTDAVESMAQLNRDAAEAALANGARAATDITGYGLTGHLGNMVRASGVSARLEADSVPVLDGAADLVEKGFVPGGTRRNQADAEAWLTYEGAVSETQKILLADAQTSGGLLICSRPDRTVALLKDLEDRGVEGAVVGRICAEPAGRIVTSGR